MDAVQRLGYVPNKAARSLVTRRADTVTLIISESEERFFSEPFFASVVRGISAALAEISRPLLLAMAQTPQQHETLERRGLPTVLGGRPPNDEPISFVDVDNVSGGAEATRHLLAAGRRRVAIICGPGDMAVSRDRLAGYRQALDEHDVAFDASLVTAGDFIEQSGQAAMAALLADAPDLDAVFASPDLMAAGALRELQSRGRSVPGDVAVVGFDDAPVARHTDPQLTTVHQPVEEMGRSMVDLLVDLIEGRRDGGHVVLAPHLVVRASS